MFEDSKKRTLFRRSSKKNEAKNEENEIREKESTIIL